MAQMRLPSGSLGDLVSDEFLNNYDDETHSKDPEFYPEDFIELVGAFKAIREGKPLTLSKVAQSRLIETVRELGWDSDVVAIRAQAAKWLKENRKP